MAKETQYDPDDMASILVEEAGGMKALASMVISNLKHGTATVQQRALNMLLVFLKRAGSRRSGPATMTEDELEKVMAVEVKNFLLALPESQYSAYIKEITSQRKAYATIVEQAASSGAG